MRSTTLRVIFALLVLAGLFYFVGAGELFRAFSELDVEYIIYLILLSVVMIWASCLKWRLFVRAAGHEVGMLHLMKLYTIGYFFNIFTPSYVGGDVARSYHLGKYLSNQKDAFVATFLERFTGLLAMALLGVSFVAIGTQATSGVEAAILLVGALAVIAAAMCFSRRVAKIAVSLGVWGIRKFIPGKWSEKLEKLVYKIDGAMAKARGDKILLANAMLLSLFFHILTVVNTYVAARAIGWQDPDVGGLFVVVPLVLLVSMAPITPSGLGIQEGAFLFFLERIGSTHAQGLAVGLILRAKVMLVAILGGLLLLGMKKADEKANL